MHVGINQDFKGPHCQGDVGGRGRDGEDIVESLLPHVMGVDGLDQVSTRHSHHWSIHGELQLPRAQLWVGVHTREPESGDDIMMSFERMLGNKSTNRLLLWASMVDTTVNY